MMKKQIFIKLMTELIKIKKDEDNLNNAFRKFEPDFNFISFGRYQTLIVNTLKEAINDEHDWISYWLYELNNGKEAKKNTVTNENGKNISIKTLNDLYNIITEKLV